MAGGGVRALHLGFSPLPWSGVHGCSRLRPLRSQVKGSSASVESRKWEFPLQAGLTAGSLVLTGDTLAQFYERWLQSNSSNSPTSRKILDHSNLWKHDWVRSLRMGSYGFFLYGPGSHIWYQFLDRMLPVQNLRNFSLKVVLNQTVLGPIVISVIFAWSSIWQGTLSELPDQYRRKAFPTLMNGWKFWTPASFINFGLVPLQARVGFMSLCAIFWNFYLSSTLVKKKELA